MRIAYEMLAKAIRRGNLRQKNINRIHDDVRRQLVESFMSDVEIVRTLGQMIADLMKP